MANIDRIVSVQIALNTAGISKEGFSTLLVVGASTAALARVATYRSAVEMTDDGYSESDPLYLAAVDFFAQIPHPNILKIGRRQVDSVVISVKNVLEEDGVYSLTVASADGSNTYSYTVQNGDAAADMLTAMLTGHEGSLSTGHANSVSDMLLRLETMVLSAEEIPLAAIRRKIASALDIIVHLGRLRDKSRRVLEITEIMGYEGDEIVLNPLFQFEDAGDAGGKVEGRLVRVNRLYHVEKLCMAGCMDAYRILSEVGETDTAGVYALAKKGEA